MRWLAVGVFPLEYKTEQKYVSFIERSSDLIFFSGLTGTDLKRLAHMDRAPTSLHPTFSIMHLMRPFQAAKRLHLWNSFFTLSVVIPTRMAIFHVWIIPLTYFIVCFFFFFLCALNCKSVIRVISQTSQSNRRSTEDVNNYSVLNLLLCLICIFDWLLLETVIGGAWML